MGTLLVTHRHIYNHIINAAKFQSDKIELCFSTNYYVEKRISIYFQILTLYFKVIYPLIEF